MKIILVRHGQTQWNKVERFRGQIDIPLNETGIAQAEAVSRYIQRNWQPAEVYSSPLSRALVTAQTIAKPFALTAVPDPGLMDINFGEWQGLTIDEVVARWPEGIWNWVHAPQVLVFPGGELLSEVQQRALEFVQRQVSSHSEETIVMVSHTVVNRLILLGLMGLGLDHFQMIRQDNCALNVLEFIKGNFYLNSMNETAFHNSIA